MRWETTALPEFCRIFITRIILKLRIGKQMEIMMKAVYAALLMGLTLLAAGCASTGGTYAGLIPRPKFLEGEIMNDVYTAKDQSFSIAIPHKDGSHEYKYMQVREQYADYAAYVSFGPAALDHSVYRFEVGRPGDVPLKFEELAPKIVEGYNIQLQKGYGSIPETLETGWVSINGRKAYHCKFKQEIPAGVYIKNRDTIFNHETYVIDFQNAVAIVWLQAPETTQQIPMELKAFAESAVILDKPQQSPLLEGKGQNEGTSLGM